MTEFNSNYCLIKKTNQIYTNLSNTLEELQLNMQFIEDINKISYEIKKLINKNDDFSISMEFNNKNDFLEDLMFNITKDDNGKYQGNTILLYANDDYMYELIHMDDLTIKDQLDDNLNQFGTISNIDLIPIYYDCVIIKTTYKNKILENTLIKLDDIVEIMKSNFYHNGILINLDNELKDILFTGDNPNAIIGHNFKQGKSIEIFGLHIVYYHEEGTEINSIASRLLDFEIKGRVFIATLCPITAKRFWNLTQQTINNILHIKENNNLLQKINKELDNDKLLNPFFLLKKYCII